MSGVLYWIAQLIIVYTYVMFARVIMGLVLQLSSWRPTGAAAVAFEMVYTVTDPPLKLLRRFIPDLRIGNFALDVSFIVLLIALRILASQLFAISLEV